MVKPENDDHIHYTESMTACQRRAFDGACRDRMHLVTGPGGAGKTFLIGRLVDRFEGLGRKVKLAAPTGKAAKRLAQATGREAETIHRLLGYNGDTYSKGPDNPIDADVLFVDEVSMLDVPLAYRLFSAVDLKRTRVVLSGDHNQLPPVGPGNVLRDILNLKLLPFTILDEVVRQAGALKHNSLDILRGRVVGTRKNDPDTPDWKVIQRFDDAEDLLNYILHLYENVLAQKLNYDLRRDVQVLAPQRKGAVGVENLNIALQALLQRKLFKRDIPPPKPNRRPLLYPGDKVMQTRNDYATGVMNGHIGYVLEADDEAGRWLIEFEDREAAVVIDERKIGSIILAYACTVHKYQGSEVPCAVCVVHSSHSFMLHRNLFYTSVSRARKQAIIVGDSKGIHRAANIQQVDDRITILQAGVS